MAQRPEPYATARILCAYGLLGLTALVVVIQPPGWLTAAALFVGALCALLGVKLGFIDSKLLARLLKLG